MADTGFVFPDTAVGNRAITDSDADWTNPDNIKADDSSDATVILVSAGDLSRGLAASNFDFSVIPAGATIDGIEVQVGDYNEGSGDALVWDNGFGTGHCKLILADNTDGSVTKHTSLTDPTTTDATDQAGGAADLWSETISDTDVKDVDWGFFVGLFTIPANGDMFIDFMQMKVYYTPGPIITDVDTDETWTDGDTGLVITGTDFT